jgi:hypothetical protein
MLFLAAITSSLSMLQPTVAFVAEALGWSHKKAVGAVAAVAFAGSSYCLWFTGGTVGWGTIDDWVGTFLIVVLAFFQIVAFAWVFGTQRGLDEAHVGAQMRIPGVIRFVIQFVAPAYLATSIFFFAKNNLADWWGKAFDSSHPNYSPVGGYSLTLVGAVALGLVFLTYVGAQRWRAAGLDLDGEHAPKD